MKVKVTQLCLILCDPIVYAVCGILQVWILEWVAFPFSRGSFQPRDRTWFSRILGRLFVIWATRTEQFYSWDILKMYVKVKVTQLCLILCDPIVLQEVSPYLKKKSSYKELLRLKNVSHSFIIILSELTKSSVFTSLFLIFFHNEIRKGYLSLLLGKSPFPINIYL